MTNNKAFSKEKGRSKLLFSHREREREKRTRFAWLRAINAHKYLNVYTRISTYIHTYVLGVADLLAWIIKVLNLVSHCGLIITTDHHASLYSSSSSSSLFSFSRRARTHTLVRSISHAIFAHSYGGSSIA